MDKVQRMQELALRLKAATECRDWQSLSQCDQEVAALLCLLTPPFVDTKILGALKAAHEAALDACSLECDALASRISEIQTNKEGWLAYALQGAMAESHK